jgi:hypothetical protein
MLLHYCRNFPNGHPDFCEYVNFKKVEGLTPPPNTLPPLLPWGREKNKCNHKGHLKIFFRKCCENVGINQRPLQKCDLNNIFHEHKGHFSTGKRALLKTWGLGPPAPPPRFLRPWIMR